MRHQQTWTNEEDKYLSQYYGKMPHDQLAKKMKRTVKAIHARARILFLYAPRIIKEYAIYKGDELLGIGTAFELAELLGVKVETVRTYVTPSRRKLAEKYNLKYGVRLDD